MTSGEYEPPVSGGVEVFAADDEVGRDLAALDWASTPLGPQANWPQSLRTTVNILLSSRFSMWMAWGPDLTFFCNSAYRRDTLGRKYPWALGRPAREVWAEIWDAIGPRIDAVLATGKATWDEALLLFLERSGYPEETYHTFSYSPLRDETGQVVGMLCVVTEDTERVIGERRMATLRDLGSDPSVVRTEEETLAFAGRQLARNPKDLPFTLTYLFEDGGARLVTATGMPDRHPAAPATLSLDDPAAEWPVAALARGESVLVTMDGAPFADLPGGAWSQPPAEALVVPLLRQGGAPFGFLVAALDRYRPVDNGYRGFVELVAGHLAAGIASARGYQAQQRRAEELAELDRAKTAFFSNISHEFRTPLTLIMGPVEELLAGLGATDERARQELEAVHRNGLRLHKLVNTLLDFSRIEAGRMQARYRPVELSTVTAELASVFRSAVDKAGLSFDIDCPSLPEPVYLDLGMWEKVVLNLLSNALKFTFDGSISVSVRAERDHAVVTIADTGVGVPAHEMPRLFERFHRIDNLRARSNEGSGIGLALVQELVGLHGGTIDADSTEGDGTRFTIRLPFGSAHLPADSLGHATSGEAVSGTADPYVQEALRWLPADPSAPPAPTITPSLSAWAASRPTAPARVLVADDNADMREYLSRMLSSAGYQVDAVADGLDALDAVRRSAPDLVVSDVMMPRLDGLSLVGALRADQRTAAVPVLLLSARAGQEASIEGLQAGADDYLVKPFAAAELLARVRAIIELARLRTHQARWRAALIDSLQEAFFVCDEDGAVIEINAGFADILGYGPEHLPYKPIHPWWPDAETDPVAHQQVAEAFAGLVTKAQGSYTVPVTHRDGHRVWISVTFNPAQDPDTGQRVIVGTFRDVTAEHYAIQRDSALSSLNACLSRAMTLREALTDSLTELKGIWRAHTAFAVLFGHGGEPTLTGTDAALSWRRLPAERRSALAELRESSPLIPVTDEAGAGILLDHPEGPMALWLDLGPNRPFTQEDQLLLALLAGHLAQGLVRVHQIDQQRETAIALQRAILGPSRLPEGFAVRYEPATRPLEVGGDWYDVIALPDHRIGIVVGDCVGRGLRAAAVMGQLRSGCHALLLQNASPAQTLMALDRFATAVPGALCTTVFCGVLDVRTGHLTYSSAGHPPGLLIRPDGTSQLLENARSLPLGIRPDAQRPEAECPLPARATLLLYTDGLVERRRQPLTAGIAEVTQAVRDGRDAGIEELGAYVMSRLAPADGYDDDVALLLYRHPAPLEVTFPAEATELAPVRASLRSWLEKCQIPPQTVQDVLVAVGEACANSIEHGHRHNPGGPIRLHAEALVNNLRLTVTDTGSWKTAHTEANSHRSRGIKMMRALMQQVDITSTPTGTTVDMRTRIA